MRAKALKRKQEKDRSVQAVEPYKKRLVCEFSAMGLEEAPQYREKRVYQGQIKESPIENEPSLAIIKPWKLSWNGKLDDHISRLIRPDLVLEKVMSFYDKECVLFAFQIV